MSRRWIAVLFLGLPLFAGETRTWELTRQDDFLEGQDFRRVVVTSRGTLEVGYDYRAVRLPRETSAWAGCLLADGNILVGTGRGRIFKIVNREECTPVFETGASLVSGLVAAGDVVYASTLPGGKIFKMNAAGQWAEFVKLDSEFVWQIEASSEGTLYAVGGKPARVYRIKADGTVSKIHEPSSDHALSIAVLGPDHLLVGTAQPAQLIELRGRKGVVLYDFGDGEVKSIVRHRGTTFAAVNSKSGVMPHELLKAVTPAEKKSEEKPADEKKKSEDRKADEYLFPISFLSDPITGTWEGDMEVKDLQIKEKLTVKLTLKDGRVAGKAHSDQAKDEVDLSGTFDEASKTLKLSSSLEEATLSIELKLVSDDSLEGTLTLAVGDQRLGGTIALRRIEKPVEAEAGKPDEKKPGENPKQEEPGTPAKANDPAPVPSPSSAPKSAVWRLSERLTEPMAEFPFYLSQIAWAGDALVAATNFQGRVLKIREDRTYEYVLDFNQAHAIGLILKGPKVHAVLLGDPGYVGFVAEHKAERGTYVSQIFDTKFLSFWGKISVRARGKVSVKTRTANVARHESTFSEWSDSLSSFPSDIKSPKGRFIQFRITLESPDAAVEGVSIAYRNENQRPKFQNLRIEYQPYLQPGDIPPLVPPQGPSPRPGMSHSPLKRITWQAQDPDSDVLSFRLYYRAVTGTAWVPLMGGHANPMNHYPWNTETVPDGIYVLKVVASDEKGNLKGEELAEEAVSDPILVDNTRPEVRIGSARAARVSGTVSDETSPIVRIEVQIDGGSWRPIPCKDGLLDSSKEDFDLDLSSEKLSRGAHVVSLRAYDQEMNVGVATATLDVP